MCQSGQNNAFQNLVVPWRAKGKGGVIGAMLDPFNLTGWDKPKAVDTGSTTTTPAANTSTADAAKKTAEDLAATQIKAKQLSLLNTGRSDTMVSDLASQEAQANIKKKTLLG
jgi:hypothetical protein